MAVSVVFLFDALQNTPVDYVSLLTEVRMNCSALAQYLQPES